MMTGLRPETFEHLQLNAGVFLREFAWDTATDKSTLEELVLGALESGEGLVGATRGGGSFECSPTVRQVEADGMRAPFVGSTINDMWTVKLKTTLLEITPENFKAALMCGEIEDKGDHVKVLKLRTDIEEGDYIPKLCWVGDTSKGMVLIELDNALNVNGANFAFTDRGEGTLPVEFQAHQQSLTDMKYAPCRIVFFDKAGE